MPGRISVHPCCPAKSSPIHTPCFFASQPGDVETSGWLEESMLKFHWKKASHRADRPNIQIIAIHIDAKSLK